jgi:thioredoxin reductase (NADPH)
VANYPGVEKATGAEIVATMRRQAESFGARILAHADVTRLDLSGSPKVVEVDDEGVFTAPAVTLATGGVPRKLGLPSEAEFQGRGISFCATCDGDFFTDQDIVVIGGGNSALEEAVSLTKYARSVTVVHEFDHFQAQPWAVDEARRNPKVRFLMEQEVREFAGSERMQKVVVASKRTGEVTEIPATGAFLFIGYLPNTRHLEGLVKLTPRGEIVTDDQLRTDVPGVFAAGDAVAKRYRQITTAGPSRRHPGTSEDETRTSDRTRIRRFTGTPPGARGRRATRRSLPRLRGIRRARCARTPRPPARPRCHRPRPW